MATATEPRWLAGLEKLGEGSYRDPATGLDVVVGKTFWRRHTRVRFSGSDPFVRAMVIIKPRLRVYYEVRTSDSAARLRAIELAARLARAYNETGGK